MNHPLSRNWNVFFALWVGFERGVYVHPNITGVIFKI